MAKYYSKAANQMFLIGDSVKILDLEKYGEIVDIKLDKYDYVYTVQYTKWESRYPIGMYNNDPMFDEWPVSHTIDVNTDGLQMHEDEIDEHKTSKFKIGDRVKIVKCKRNNGKTGKIQFIRNVYDGLKSRCLYYVDFGDKDILTKEYNGFVTKNLEKTYCDTIDMEERNVKLSIETARKWYKKGGELREVALQAFTEDEITMRPKSWEAYIKMHKRVGFYVDGLFPKELNMPGTPMNMSDVNLLPNSELATAFITYMTLTSIHYDWMRSCGWVYKPGDSYVYIDVLLNGKVIVNKTSDIRRGLMFPTTEMATEFIEAFEPQIKIASIVF